MHLPSLPPFEMIAPNLGSEFLAPVFLVPARSVGRVCSFWPCLRAPLLLLALACIGTSSASLLVEKVDLGKSSLIVGRTVILVGVGGGVA